MSRGKRPLRTPLQGADLEDQRPQRTVLRWSDDSWQSALDAAMTPVTAYTCANRQVTILVTAAEQRIVVPQRPRVMPSLKITNFNVTAIVSRDRGGRELRSDPCARPGHGSADFKDTSLSLTTRQSTDA